MGYTFTPASMSYTRVQANQTLQNYAANPGLFTLTGSMAMARDSQTSTLLPNGLVLLAGGTNSDPTSELYSSATGQFSATVEYCDGRSNQTATPLTNGLVLLAGGQNGTAYLEPQLYNPANGYWTPTYDMVTPRADHTATLLPNGQVLITGGTDFLTFSGGTSGNFLSSAELYDPVANSFSSLGNIEHHPLLRHSDPASQRQGAHRGRLLLHWRNPRHRGTVRPSPEDLHAHRIHGRPAGVPYSDAASEWPSPHCGRPGQRRHPRQRGTAQPGHGPVHHHGGHGCWQAVSHGGPAAQREGPHRRR